MFQMARSERSGSIFTRILGLIRSGAMKWEDRPIWFDAYAAHPPFEEPTWDLKMPKNGEPMPEIYYREDIERARKMLEMRGDQPKHQLDQSDNGTRS